MVAKLRPQGEGISSPRSQGQVQQVWHLSHPRLVSHRASSASELIQKKNSKTGPKWLPLESNLPLWLLFAWEGTHQIQWVAVCMAKACHDAGCDESFELTALRLWGNSSYLCFHLKLQAPPVYRVQIWATLATASQDTGPGCLVGRRYSVWAQQLYLARWLYSSSLEIRSSCKGVPVKEDCIYCAQCPTLLLRLFPRNPNPEK